MFCRELSRARAYTSQSPDSSLDRPTASRLRLRPQGGSAMNEMQLPAPKLIYGGGFHDAKQGRTQSSVNPATGQTLGQVAAASVEDVDAAVTAARKAFEGDWARTNGDDRSKLLWKLGDLIERHKEEIARLETLDSG